MAHIMGIDEFVNESAGARLVDRTPERFNSDPLVNKKPNNVLDMKDNPTRKMVEMSAYINSELLKYIKSNDNYADFFMLYDNSKLGIGVYEADSKMCSRLILFVPGIYDSSVFGFIPSDIRRMNKSQINALEHDDVFIEKSRRSNDFGLYVKDSIIAREFLKLNNGFERYRGDYHSKNLDINLNKLKCLNTFGVSVVTPFVMEDTVNGVSSIGGSVFGKFKQFFADDDEVCCLVNVAMNPSLTKEDAGNRIALSKTIIDGLYDSVYNYFSNVFM